MSDQVGAITNNEAEPPSPQTDTSKITKDPVSQAGAAQANKDESSSGNSFSSLADLRTREPKFYNQMMQSLGMNICNKMRGHQERLKKMMREAKV